MKDDTTYNKGSGSDTLSVEDFVKSIPDFPKPGITFLHLAPLLQDPRALDTIASQWADHYRTSQMPDVIAGIESRGFLFGILVAQKLDLPFVMFRKAGKLPHAISSQRHEMEYGSTILEAEKGSLTEGQSVLIIDDVAATGGTLIAACELIDMLGARIHGVSCLIEIVGLGAREALGDHELHAIASMPDG